MNDTELLKIATRAWKMNFGSLSEKSQNLLKAKKILVHDKELAGLNRGTANIIKANGGVQKDLNLVEAFNAMKSMPRVQRYKSHVSNEDYKAILTSNLSAFQQSARHINLASEKPIVSSSKYAPGIVGSKASTYQDIGGVHTIIGYNTNSKADNYVKGILDRHEADELRYTMKARRTKGQSGSMGDIDSELTATPQGHLSNDVILRESSHVAIAPKYTRNAFKGMRNEATGEPDYIRNVSQKDFTYGKEAVPQKHLSRQLTREQVKANTTFYREGAASLGVPFKIN